VESFESYRPYLFSIAYRMLGSAMDAEDLVQETYLRYQGTPPETIRSLKAFLTTILTRLCMDQLQLARRKREVYVGPWLPEPILTTTTPASEDPAERVEREESISLAFLALLEELQPFERAVFLLHEVFGYEFSEIATKKPISRVLFFGHLRNGALTSSLKTARVKERIKDVCHFLAHALPRKTVA